MPRRSPSHELVGTITPRASVYAVVTHSMSSSEVPTSFCMFGIATFTMLVSSTDMNMPTTTTPSGSPHFSVTELGGAVGPDGRGGGRGGGGAVGRSPRDLGAINSTPCVMSACLLPHGPCAAP